MSNNHAFGLKHYKKLMRLVENLPRECRVPVAHSLCDMLSSDNPNFNRNKFLACLGGQDDHHERHTQHD